jgi:hypothetical protein
MDVYTESERGNRARDLLANPMFRETINELRTAIADKWRAAPMRDIEGQHELKIMDKLLTDIEAYIKKTADTGKMADIQLERDTKVAELKRHGIR